MLVREPARQVVQVIASLDAWEAALPSAKMTATVTATLLVKVVVEAVARLSAKVIAHLVLVDLSLFLKTSATRAS